MIIKQTSAKTYDVKRIDKSMKTAFYQKDREIFVKTIKNLSKK